MAEGSGQPGNPENSRRQEDPAGIREPVRDTAIAARNVPLGPFQKSAVEKRNGRDFYSGAAIKNGSGRTGKSPESQKGEEQKIEAVQNFVVR